MADRIGDIELGEIWNRVVKSIDAKLEDFGSEEDIWKAMHGYRGKFEPQMETLMKHDFPTAFWDRVVQQEKEDIEDLDLRLLRLEEQLASTTYEIERYKKLEQDLTLGREIKLDRRIALDKKLVLEKEVGIERDIELERIYMTKESIEEKREEKKKIIEDIKILTREKEGVLWFIPVRPVVKE
ncbi:MAG: hypothetical protein DDT41_01380 [candidate division WS2 bacterium]|nr:hypothetical protein [Candidatus Psychracetigena formicireducens]